MTTRRTRDLRSLRARCLAAARAPLRARRCRAPATRSARGAMLLGAHQAGIAIEQSMLGATARLREPADGALRHDARRRDRGDAAARGAVERRAGRRIATPTLLRASGAMAGATRASACADRLEATGARRRCCRDRCASSACSRALERRSPPTRRRSGPAPATRGRSMPPPRSGSTSRRSDPTLLGLTMS